VQFTVLTILAVHAVVLGVVLLQGCKRTATDPNAELQALATNYPPPEAVAPPPASTAPPQVTQLQPTPINVPSTTTHTPPAAQIETQPPPIVVAPPAPVDPTPVAPAPAGTASQHVVVKGDSFSTIAKKYNVTTKAIADANPGVDSSRLKIGQKLNVPAPTLHAATGSPGSGSNGSEKTYVVRSGDTLFKIAKTTGTTPKALRAANKLRTDQIKVGQKLVIPSKGSAPMEAAGGTGSQGLQAAPLP
jgi:LysM repeat protein